MSGSEKNGRSVMSRYIDADALRKKLMEYIGLTNGFDKAFNEAPTIDIVRCEECRKSHIDGKTTHYLWCTEWGRSTDTFGYCERADRAKGE